VLVGQLGEPSDPLAQLAHLAVLERAPSARAGAGGARVGVVKALREQGAARGCLAAERSALGGREEAGHQEDERSLVHELQPRPGQVYGLEDPARSEGRKRQRPVARSG